MQPDWTNVWQAVGTVAGVVVSLIGFIFVSIQLKHNRSSLETQTYTLVYQLGHGIYHMFIEHPELRPYFYDNEPIPDGKMERSKVLAASELICDFFEYIVHERSNLDPSIRDAAFTHMKSMYANNQALRHFVDESTENYSQHFIQVLTNGRTEIKREKRSKRRQRSRRKR